MRWLLAGLILVAACGGKKSPDPAWPKSAGHVPPETWEEDGGESLEPQGDTSVESSETDGEGETLDDPELQALIEEALKTPVADPPVEEMIIIDEGDPPAPDAPPPPAP